MQISNLVDPMYLWNIHQVRSKSKDDLHILVSKCLKKIDSRYWLRSPLSEE